MTSALITGAAGFIGHHLALRFLAEGWDVTGVDAMTPIAEPHLKDARLARLTGQGRYTHVTGRVEAPGLLMDTI